MKKIFLGVAASNFAGAGFGFLVTVFLARVLDVASFGKANFIFSLVAILAGVADFGFGSSLVIFCNRFRVNAPQDPLVIANTVYLKFLLVVALIAIPLMAGVRHFYFLSAAESAVIYLSFLLYSLYRYLTSIHQATGNWKRYNTLLIVNNVVKFFSVALLVLAAGTLFPLLSRYGAVLTGYLCYALIIFIIAVLLTRQKIKVTGSAVATMTGEFHRLLLPVGTAGLLVVFSMRFDSIVIQKYLGSHDLGIYSAANTLAFAFPLITVSLMNVLLKESAAGADDFLPKIMAAQKRYLPFLVMLFVLVFTLSGTIIPLLFGTSYTASVNIFRILLVPYIGGIFFTPLESYFYAQEQKTILYLKFAQMLTVVVGSLLMIGPLRLAGVATAILLSRLFGWIFLIVKSRRILANKLYGH